jgi:hypothetical protein
MSLTKTPETEVWKPTFVNDIEQEDWRSVYINDERTIYEVSSFGNVKNSKYDRMMAQNILNGYKVTHVSCGNF